jgi:hypothetical protein
MQEVLQQVVIGMGRLDVNVDEIIDPVDEQSSSRARESDRINPYFSSISSNFSPSSSSTFHPWSSSAPSRSIESTSLRSGIMGPVTNVSPGTEFPPSLPPTFRSYSPVGSVSTIEVNW